MKPITDEELRSALREVEFSYSMSRDMARANPNAPELKKSARNDLAKVLAIKRWIADRKLLPHRQTA